MNFYSSKLVDYVETTELKPSHVLIESGFDLIDGNYENTIEVLPKRICFGRMTYAYRFNGAYKSYTTFKSFLNNMNKLIDKYQLAYAVNELD